MLLIHCILAIAIFEGTAGQLFGRFGFEFPGFSAPEAFENEDFGNIQQRIADLMKGSTKPKKGVKTKVKTMQRGKFHNS